MARWLRHYSGCGGKFVMEVVVVEIVASMVIVCKFELWFHVVGSFTKVLRLCTRCCNVGIRVRRRSEVMCLFGNGTRFDHGMACKCK